MTDRTMTAEEFRAAGSALFRGATGWQTALAEELGVNPRTVRRWAAGTSRIPPGVAAHMGRSPAEDPDELVRMVNQAHCIIKTVRPCRDAAPALEDLTIARDALDRALKTLRNT